MTARRLSRAKTEDGLPILTKPSSNLFLFRFADMAPSAGRASTTSARSKSTTITRRVSSFHNILRGKKELVIVVVSVDDLILITKIRTAIAALKKRLFAR